MVMVEVPFDVHREIRRRGGTEYALVANRATGDPLYREAGTIAEQMLKAGGYSTNWSDTHGEETPSLLVDITDRRPEVASARLHTLGARVIPIRFDTELDVVNALPDVLAQAPNFALDGSDTLAGVRFISSRITDDWWHVIRYAAQFEHTPRDPYAPR
jgi:hypothetical protein